MFVFLWNYFFENALEILKRVVVLFRCITTEVFSYEVLYAIFSNYSPICFRRLYWVSKNVKVILQCPKRRLGIAIIYSTENVYVALY